MSGNTSKTFIEKQDNTNVFVKKVPVDRFDTRTVSFQSNLRQIIKGKFNINRYENIKVVPYGNDLYYQVQFEFLKEKPWAPNKENMTLIGQAMALIHNHCARNKQFITLPIKTEKYDSMLDWSYIDMDIPFAKESFERRKEIFEQIERFNPDQQKIPLHRDFKPHNILFDGENYHLIDFDFAAVDYIGLEIMSFVVDIIDSGLANVKYFLKSYIEHIDIEDTIEGLDMKTIVDDYLNYLCTNRFPFYMHDKLEPQNFKNLVDHRNKSLETLWEKRATIKQTIDELTYESI